MVFTMIELECRTDTSMIHLDLLIYTVKLVKHEHGYSEFSDIAKFWEVPRTILYKSLQTVTVIMNSDVAN